MYKGVIKGRLDDGKAIIPCRIFNAAAADRDEFIWVDGRALIDTGATDVLIRQQHADALRLESDEPPLAHECVGTVQTSVPYRTIVQLAGETLDESPGPYRKGFGQARTFVTTFAADVDFVLGMNVLSMTFMQFAPSGEFEIKLLA